MTDEPTLFEMAEESMNLVAGAVTALLPLFVLSVPIIFPLAVFGGLLTALLALVAGILAAPAVLVVVLVRRLR
jgi:hypothetical protein